MATTDNPPDERKTRLVKDQMPSARPMPVRVTTTLNIHLPWVLEFHLVGTVSTVQVHVREKMMIGRGGNDTHIRPEVDLAPYNAQDFGVSRQHALILVRDNHLVVKDLGSTNGTRLNNFALTAEQEYPLQHGDLLTVGLMELKVIFAVIPAHEGESQDLQMKYTHTPILGHGEHVLVVQSGVGVANIFRLALEFAGFKATVLDGANGMKYLMDKLPDAIVLDLMQDKSGLELVRFVRKQAGGKSLPFIVVSSTVDDDLVNEARDAGVDYVMSKPVCVDDLVRAVSLLAAEPQDATRPLSHRQDIR